MNSYTTPLKAAGIRFARTFFYGAVSAVIFAGIASLTAFDGTAAALLIVPTTAALTAVDKWARAKKETIA